MQSKDVLNPSSCWVPSGFPVLALGSHTTGVDKSKPTKQKSLTINRSIRSMRPTKGAGGLKHHKFFDGK